jgi:hypothetical protein
MLMTEWNWDDALAVRFKEGHELGLEKGEQIGIQKERQLFLDLLNQGLSVEEIKQRLG